MAWYNKQTQSYLSILSRPLNPIQIILSDNLLIDIKSKHPRLLSQLDVNFISIINCIMELALVVPSNSDNNDRKYKYPHCAVSFVQKLINLYDFNPMQITEYLNLMFERYFQNQTDVLSNTLIPAYLSRLFDSIYFKYRIQTIQYFKDNQSINIKLLGHIEFDCIAKILKMIVVNEKTKNEDAILLHKILIIQKIVGNIIQQCTNSWKLLNSLQIIFEVAQQYNSIEDGLSFMQIISSQLVIPKYIKIIQTCQSNYYCFAFEILKCCFTLHNHSYIYLQQIWNHFLLFNQKQILSKQKPPQIKLKLMVQLTIVCLKHEKNYNKMTEIFKKFKIIQFLLDVLQIWSEFNILINKIEFLISQILCIKDSYLTQYLFDQCQIIQRTILKMRNYNSFTFGVLVKIAECYVEMRIETPKICSIIEKNFENWEQLSKDVLNPYIKIISKKNWEDFSLNELQSYKQIQGKLKIPFFQPSSEIQFTVINFTTELSHSFLRQTQQTLPILKINQKYQQEQNINIITLNKRSFQQPKETINDHSISDQPIKINFPSYTNQKLEQKSFQEYMTKNKQYISKQKEKVQRPKSKAKLKSTDTKRNKWKSDENQYLIPETNHFNSQKKGSRTTPIKQIDLQKIKLIKIKNKMIKTNTHIKRQIDSQKDIHLKSWLKLINTNDFSRNNILKV